MKQQIVIKQNQSSDSGSETRKEKLEKKRMIRKSKIQLNINEVVDLKTIDTSSLSREQKARIQKAKNREAAQKSRDMHRQYVTKLQNQINELKVAVKSSRKICWKCQRQLQENSSHQSSLSDLQTDERSKSQKIFSFEKEDEPFRDQESLEHFQHFQQESYMRVQDSSDQNSYMKMILLVCMIVVAVMWVGGISKSNSTTPSRALMEFPQIENTQKTNNDDKNTTDKIANKTEIVQTAIVPIQNGLIAWNTDDCLNSLMKVDSSRQEKKSLRTYHENNPSSSASQTYLASKNKQGILLCTVRTPKPYQSRFQKLRSPLVKLYLLGSEIKQMLTHSSLLMPIRDSNIQINGLYRVAAQIKDVSLVNDHNCLL